MVANEEAAVKNSVCEVAHLHVDKHLSRSPGGHDDAAHHRQRLRLVQSKAQNTSPGKNVHVQIIGAPWLRSRKEV